MEQEIYDPLKEYITVYKDRFMTICKATFAQLADEAKVDEEANWATCKEIYSKEDIVSSLKDRLGRWHRVSVVLWTVVVIGALILMANFSDPDGGQIAMASIAIAAALAILYMKVKPMQKELQGEHDRHQSVIDGLKSKAYTQMEPLNSLYDWDILTRMIAKTVPMVKFDPYFTKQRLADLVHVYGWMGSSSENKSVIYSHSGLINGNPFVICRTREMVMGLNTYYGEKTIHWTTKERGSDGKYHTVQHSQTLRASYTAPYPEYYETSQLIYGNTAAPRLIFNRRQSGLAGKEDSRAFRQKRKELRNKARDLSNNDFAMMTNEEFETIFDTSNRNDNQQYALLFTPLAQESMTRLLKDKENGYGDDFDFDKNRMINTITPDHLQTLDLDMNPDLYRNFDYDEAEKRFYEINAEYFRAIYFSLAPLLCIPMYQQIRSQKDIYGTDMQQHSCFLEHESLANFWGQEHFMAPNCVTNCILKTKQTDIKGDDSTIKVYAHGHTSVRRVEYVTVHGDDGKNHRVPVYWDEYFPVTGTGQFHIREDNTSLNEDAASQHQRIDYINKVLREGKMQLYRRHISSRR